MSSKEFAKQGDILCWYVEMQSWFQSYGININAVPDSSISSDCPCLDKMEAEKNRVI